MALFSGPTAVVTLAGSGLAPGERSPFGVVLKVDPADALAGCESCGRTGDMVVLVTFVDTTAFVICSPCYSATIDG